MVGFVMKVDVPGDIFDICRRKNPRRLVSVGHGSEKTPGGGRREGRNGTCSVCLGLILFIGV